MPVSKRKKSGEKGNSTDRYKMVVLRADTFQEVRSFDLSLGSIYVLTSVVVLLIVLLLTLLVIFTPVKRLIPGYGDLENTPEFLELVTTVQEIEEALDAQGAYIQAISNLINQADTGQDPANSTQINGNANGTTLSIPPVNARNNSDEIQADLSSNEFWTSLSDQGMIRPVEGIINSDFDPSIKHFGVDILAPEKTPIVTIMDGFVFSSGWDLETGYTIGIQHDGNFLSFYKHNSQLLKEKGTFVKAGEAVAIIGNTGTLSTGPHLHFELWHNGKPINPTEVLNFN